MGEYRIKHQNYSFSSQDDKVYTYIQDSESIKICPADWTNKLSPSRWKRFFVPAIWSM